MKKGKRIFACDFETEVYDGQKETKVWLWGACPLYTEDIEIGETIESFFEFLTKLNENVILYFHNLRFDGSFILYYLEQNGYKNTYNEEAKEFEKLTQRKTYKYLVTEFNQWYKIDIMLPNKKHIEIKDSLKLMPLDLRTLEKSFETRHNKLNMEYIGKRNNKATEEEVKYLKNDVFVLKECLEKFKDFASLDNLTISSNAIAEFYKGYFDEDIPKMFECLSTFEYDFIKKSYRGGWCYCNPIHQNKICKDIIVLDVNSLYPSVMNSISNSRYPIGKGDYYKGAPIIKKDTYTFIHFKCSFELKKNYLPTVQIKGNFLYNPREYLTTSDIYDEEKNKYYKQVGNINNIVEMTMSQTDFELFQEHYNISNLEYIDNISFDTELGIFDKYINKWYNIKRNEKGAKRQIAKLFLNSLYGRFAQKPENCIRLFNIDKEEECLKSVICQGEDKKMVNIAIASAITSYARAFTIKYAQANYKNFAYADTDSLHLVNITDENEIVINNISDTELLSWKCERKCKYGKYLRAKSYIEWNDTTDIDIKCAGLPNKFKELFIQSINNDYTNINEYSIEGQKFLKEHHTIDDFHIGFKIPCKLVQKQIKGGCVLQETEFTVRKV